MLLLSLLVLQHMQRQHKVETLAGDRAEDAASGVRTPEHLRSACNQRSCWLFLNLNSINTFNNICCYFFASVLQREGCSSSQVFSPALQGAAAAAVAAAAAAAEIPA